MGKYIIAFDNRYGEIADVVEASSQEEAEDFAYDAARQEWESNVSYSAVKLNREDIENYGLDYDEEEE